MILIEKTKRRSLQVFVFDVTSTIGELTETRGQSKIVPPLFSIEWEIDGAAAREFYDLESKSDFYHYSHNLHC